MPAETHQHREAAGPDAVLELLAYVADVDDEHPAEVRLADLQLDDTFSMMGLWDAVVEELGERSVGADPDLDFDDAPPRTLGELAELFARGIVSDRS